MYDPPLYEWENWHYQKANIEKIKKAISEFLCERRFANSNVIEKMYLINKTIKIIIFSYIPRNK